MLSFVDFAENFLYCQSCRRENADERERKRRLEKQDQEKKLWEERRKFQKLEEEKEKLQQMLEDANLVIASQESEIMQVRLKEKGKKLY